MTSKQKPKRLQIIGSDEREHNFLVKGGDDLRGDQRVEQLFTTINKLLRADAGPNPNPNPNPNSNPNPNPNPPNPLTPHP